MPLNVGSRLGHYDVTALIGEGGMGQVYQATDTKLNRQVALKILPEAFATDPDRLARFQREAQVLASLNHPNIAQIHGIEEDEGTRALVLELVEGPTLAERIKQGPIPLDEALPIAKQIAEALEAAHEAGVIHRDLKPANIKVKDDGTVKVLDFGLAKALDPSPEGDPSRSPTLTAAATQMGVIMGTAAYMSPEQARGKTVDRRADIWSFGVVLYEMLTGVRPFRGEDVSLTLASVMKSDVDVKTLPPALPETLRTVLRRCLEKDPLQRVRDIGDVRLAMEGAFESAPSERTGARQLRQLQVWQRPAPAAVAIFALVVLTAVGVWNLPRSTTPSRLVRFAINTPVGGPLAVQLDRAQGTIAFSPDGSRVVYRSGSPQYSGGELYVRDLAQSEAVPLPGTDGALGPFFSADGEWVAFQDGQDNALKRVPVLGGAPLTICPLPGRLRGASWGPDGTIVFGTTNSGLMWVPAVGGDPEPLTVLDAEQGEVGHWWPEVLPDGDSVLFTVWSGSQSRIAVVSLDTGVIHGLLPSGSSPLYAATGHLVYAETAAVLLTGSLRVVRFDLDRLETIGSPVPVLEDVAMGATGVANYDLSDAGAIAYVSDAATQTAERTLVWVDRLGESEPLVEAMADYSLPRLSPDGGRVAVTIGGATGDIWICDIGRACSPLTRQGGWYPVWSPDGTQIAFSSTAAGDHDLYSIPADGSGDAELLLERPQNQYAISWSPDGGTLAFSELSVTSGGLDNFLLPLDGEPEPFLVTEFDERSPTFSPDGRWIAYRSSMSGQMQLYARPYPGDGGRKLVSIEGGEEPVWSRDSRQLYFRDGTRLMVVDVGDGPTFEPSTPRFLFEGFDIQVGGSQNYDITEDGQRFVMVSSDIDGVAGQPSAELNIVLHWSEELKRLAPTN